MDEKERLEEEAQQLREEIKQMQLQKSLNNIQNKDIIKEKRDKLFHVLTSLEFISMDEEKNKIGKSR